MRKRITRPKLVAGREKEEGSAGAVRDAKLAQRLHHRLHAVMVCRHGEHAKGLPSEMLLMCPLQTHGGVLWSPFGEGEEMVPCGTLQ